MSLYLSLKMFAKGGTDLFEPNGSKGTDLDVSDTQEEKPEEERKLLRSVEVTLDKGHIRIESVASDFIDSFTADLNEQLTNEFLVQVEMLNIKKWSPIHYSPAFAGGERCSWILEFCGLKGESTMHTGDDTYPKNWPVLIDIINAFNSMQILRNESVRMAADGMDSVLGTSLAGAVDMVNILTVMQMPQDVIAVGIFRNLMKQQKLDMDYVEKYFDRTVVDLLGEYGDDSGLEPEERRLALIEHVKASNSMYFKRLALAEVLSDLIAVKAKMDRGEDFDDPVMSQSTMGLYYAEMISALGALENDQRAATEYARLVDLYKTMFVSYWLDSIRGTIYQTQGDTAGVMLKRGEYDWRAIDADVPDDASPVSKELALFFASLWRREADEMLVKTGNKEGKCDIPDTTALKVVMGKSTGRKARKNNQVVLSILKRMITEDEQLLTAIKADEPEIDLIENGEVDNVEQIPVSFLGLEDEDGGVMAAVFTSMDELGEVDGDDIEAIPVKMIFQFIKSMGRLDGIIIDPFSDRFVITKEKIAEILDDIAKDQNDLI